MRPLKRTLRKCCEGSGIAVDFAEEGVEDGEGDVEGAVGDLAFVDGGVADEPLGETEAQAEDAPPLAAGVEGHGAVAYGRDELDFDAAG